MRGKRWFGSAARRSPASAIRSRARLGRARHRLRAHVDRRAGCRAGHCCATTRGNPCSAIIALQSGGQHVALNATNAGSQRVEVEDAVLIEQQPKHRRQSSVSVGHGHNLRDDPLYTGPIFTGSSVFAQVSLLVRFHELGP